MIKYEYHYTDNRIRLEIVIIGSVPVTVGDDGSPTEPVSTPSGWRKCIPAWWRRSIPAPTPLSPFPIPPTPIPAIHRIPSDIPRRATVLVRIPCPPPLLRPSNSPTAGLVGWVLRQLGPLGVLQYKRINFNTAKPVLRNLEIVVEVVHFLLDLVHLLDMFLDDVFLDKVWTLELFP